MRNNNDEIRRNNMGWVTKHLSKGSIAGLLIMLLLLPVIPCGLIWHMVSPVTVWQTMAMVILLIILYICFFLVEMALIVIMDG
jgi:hypothetical protein